MAILDLAFHPFAYVTISELAEYWRLGRRSVLDHIKAGHVEAIQLSPGLYRIRTITALTFERNCAVPSARPGGVPPSRVDTRTAPIEFRQLGRARKLRDAKRGTPDDNAPPSTSGSSSIGR